MIFKKLRQLRRSRRQWPEISLDEMRKWAKMLVIDDKDFVYLDLFSRDGYTFDKWNDIDDLTKLETGYYDIILLDIHGVGEKLSKEGGFGVLKHLRATCPAQILVAFSCAEFDLKYQEFFRMADSTLSKSSDYFEFKRTVDNLLRDRFSLSFYTDRASKIVGSHLTDLSRFRAITTSAITSGNKTKLARYLEDNVESKEDASLILQIVEVAISIGALL